MARFIKNSLRAVESEELMKSVAADLSKDDPQNAERILAEYYGKPENTEEGEVPPDDDSERDE